MKYKKGDAVAYRKKDQIGYVWVTALVERDRGGVGVDLRTDPGGVHITVLRSCLTKVKTVWMSSHKEVIPASDTPRRRLEAALALVGEACRAVEDLRDDLQQLRDAMPLRLRASDKADELEATIDDLSVKVDELDQAQCHDIRFPRMKSKK